MKMRTGLQVCYSKEKKTIKKNFQEVTAETVTNIFIWLLS